MKGVRVVNGLEYKITCSTSKVVRNLNDECCLHILIEQDNILGRGENQLPNLGVMNKICRHSFQYSALVMCVRFLMAGLSAAALKAKLLVDHEERDIQCLAENIVSHEVAF